MDFIPGVKLTDVVRHRPKQQQQQQQQQQEQQQILQQKEAAGPAAAATGQPGVGVGESSSWWGRTIGAYFSRRSVPACLPALGGRRSGG